METLPPPPSPDADASPGPPVRPYRAPRAGELTTGWRILTGIGWIGIAAVLAATWNVSRQLGLSTWWLGPVYDQRPPYVTMLPFVAPAVVLTLVVNRVRHVPWIGLLGAAAIAAVGLGDLGRVRGIGVVELIAAAAALLVSIASFSGMYRSDDGNDDAGTVDEIGEGSADDDVVAVVPAGEPAPG
ncbi:MAG TPA: hypothetical protein VFV63_07300 [Ilumatobacteraceae bacterium]|nr:hypothetical protein [Ilumatobacteraceae bacterium]